MTASLVYFESGDVIAESGNVKVYSMHGQHFLEHGPGHNLWTHTWERKEITDQIGDLPYGDCLEIGLGLGMASTYILSKSGVKSMTSIEINEDVLEVYRQLNPVLDPRHKMVYGDGYEYLLQTDRTFDFIYLDNYAQIDEDTLPEIELMVNKSKERLNSDGVVMGWLDVSTPEEFALPFFELFEVKYET